MNPTNNGRVKLVKVEEVKSDPRVGNPPKVLDADYGYGIQNQEQARAWGARKGFPLVYWWRNRQRAFAERTNRVDLAAKRIETNSESLVEFAQALAEGRQA